MLKKQRSQSLWHDRGGHTSLRVRAVPAVIVAVVSQKAQQSFSQPHGTDKAEGKRC